MRFIASEPVPSLNMTGKRPATITATVIILGAAHASATQAPALKRSSVYIIGLWKLQ
jgi:hypothetical protein